MPLDRERIKELLKFDELPKPKGASLPASAVGLRGAGPIRYSDKPLTCINAGYYNSEGVWHKGKKCGSPTHYKFQGMPMCSAHVIMRANALFYKMGVEQ